MHSALPAARLARCVLVACRRLWPVCAGLVAAPTSRPRRAAKITYDEHVRPIFREHCYTCHNQDTQEERPGDRQLTPPLMRGGASGEVVDAGDPDSSRLWALVNHTDEPKMPPKQDKLADAKLAIDQGLDRWAARWRIPARRPKPKKPTMNLSVSAGSAKPDGPPPMPEGLCAAAGRLHRPARQR